MSVADREQEQHWMRHALRLAERGRGHVEPNPLVGAVVVRDGRIVGEGWHQQFGRPHAEIHALSAAGEAARGATLYVTLEPCCHHGKTPPCTDAVIQAGIARVVAAMSDPFPQVAGQGIAQLRAAGMIVEVGIEEAEARRVNAPFIKLTQSGRPYVIAKWAMTLDGKIATRTGDSKWISGEASRRRVHELRGRMDGILVGIGTALADDPLLTTRPPGPRTATRIVLDHRGRLPPTSHLARTAREVPVLVVTHPSTPGPQTADLKRLGCEILPVATLDELLQELGRRRFTNLLVEGGATILGSFLDAGMVDEVHVFLAPLILGGKESLSPVAGNGVDRIAQALRVLDWEVEQVETDVWLRGRIEN